MTMMNSIHSRFIFCILTFVTILLHSSATPFPLVFAVSSSASSTTTTTTTTFTLPIFTFRLDLTIQENDNDRRLQLPQRSSHWLSLRGRWDRPRFAQETNNNPSSFSSSVEGTIQSVAETHLSAIYAGAFVAAPSQVLLTVVPEEEGHLANDGSSSEKIQIRSYLLGGVVSFPTYTRDSSSSSSSSPPNNIFDQLPTRSEVAKVTVEAFQIPGNGGGEQFLNALQDANHPDLKGLLLINAEEVTQEGEGGDVTDESISSSSGSSSTDGESSMSFTSMNIWAIAAVAALAAMLLVILLCTSILYCDWRKRKERRERKRERLAAMSSTNAAGSYINNTNTNHSYAGSFRDEKYLVENVKRRPGLDYLQIVVPTAGSGETEDVHISPSTVGGETTPSPPPQDIAEAFDTGSNTMTSKVKKYRRTSLPKSKKLIGKKQSKAAYDQLRLAEDVAIEHTQPQPSFVDPRKSQPGGSGMGYDAGVNGDDQHYYDDAIAAHTTTLIGSTSDIIISNSVGEDVYSVGEDTTMLFPAITRDHSESKDNMSDFDGYSIDGMSAVDGGYSQFGDSSGGGGGGVRSSKKSSTRDMYSNGEVPRDFDSIWGDDDASRLTNDTTDASRDYPAAASTTKNAYSLNKLVEYDYEESSQAASAGRDINLHEFENESETSGSNQIAGAFTLELLGKSKTIKLHKTESGGSSVSVTPSSQDDDDDSILGRMYHDEESSELMAYDGDRHDEYNISSVVPVRSGDSVDSTPSWAAPIQSALQSSAKLFRPNTTKLERKQNDAVTTANSLFTKNAQEQRTKDKFVSSLQGDDSSIGSNRSRGSHRSNYSSGSRGSNSSRHGSGAVISNEKALGLTNSMDEEIDEDPATMIDNINSMLSECREILDTENSSL